MAEKEINLVLKLVEKGASAVEKETHVLWDQNDLLEARFREKFQNEDQITEPTGNSALSSIYPGCLNMIGKSDSRPNCEPIAETSHFLIFGLPSGSEIWPT